MKKKIILSVMALSLFGFSAQAEEAKDTEMKNLSKQLCDILVKSDKETFTKMIAEKRQGDVRWWWDASGKGKDFKNLFSKCQFDHIDAKFSTDVKKKVFIQRYDKDGKKWGRPAPVVWEKQKDSAWKITSYSL